mmetsp:Transcript_68322/g.222190  ORF Transcript_68322/g.222190 Transcript_68322/m.222190 type:complete len:285 (+) Transcript_68322:69-923(+)
MAAQSPLLPPPPPPPDVLIRLDGASFGFDDAEATTLTNVNLELRPGMKLLLLGPMGSGKSTLLNGLSGRLAPRAGSRTMGRWLQLLFWEQCRPGSFDLEDETPTEFVLRLADGSSDEAAASEVLTALGIDESTARRPCCCLSSGEQTLVSLAALTIAPKHLLLLDEPTAFLHASAAETIADALRQWEGGTIVCTSSSRAFCEALQFTHVARLHPSGEVVVYARPPCEEDWAREWAAASMPAVQSVADGAAASAPAVEPQRAEKVNEDGDMGDSPAEQQGKRPRV